eukprot:TRINITY_DN4702_c6_g1_i1.p1 TRINITY_DN4702_c6_g1~~TRINITY_DN4702_c6_g1_i1.p1  ORF type:complete len:828 (+),score=138.30 TRINITY_DN4702_c6_g1_i1:47-2530(+)
MRSFKGVAGGALFTLSKSEDIMDRRPGSNFFKSQGSKSGLKANVIAKAIGGSAATTKMDAAWFPHKLIIPNMEGHGMDHDYAVSFPNPLEPHKCYSWDYDYMEERSNILTIRHKEPIPALYRVHTADVVSHEIRNGREVIMSHEDHPELEEHLSATSGYVHFSLYKEGLRTTQAIFALAKKTNLPLTSFSWSVGMDSKAATTQRVSVAVVGTVEGTINMLKSFKKASKGRIELGSFEHSEEPIKLESSYGKRVAMLLRNVRASPEEMAEKMDALENGFVNFFGPEKFGLTQGVQPHQIAALTLQGKYKEAFMSILEMEGFMNPIVERIRKNIDAREMVSRSMADKVPSHLPHVRCLLFGILTHKSYKAAYYSIAPAMRRMWESSLSALIWNQLASTRIERYGKQVVVGDSVFDRELGEAVTVTEDNIGKYTLFDVVLLVPGFPSTETNTAFWPELEGIDQNAVMQILESHGVTYPFMLAKEHTVTPPEFRQLFIKPFALQYDIFQHEMVNERVIATDPNAPQLDVFPGTCVSVNDKGCSTNHPLKTKGLAGMMYTFDWTCIECNTRNVFVRDRCTECDAFKDLSVSNEERERQKHLNGDLKNCNSVYISFAIPHSSYGSVAVRDAFALHPWRFYPDGYFYQDVIQPLLQFHLDKPRVSMPPSVVDLRDDSWVFTPRTSCWKDSALSGIFAVPSQRVDEWYRLHSWREDSLGGTVNSPTSKIWREESEAWWNIDLDAPVEAREQQIDYVHDTYSGGVIKRTEKDSTPAGRALPPQDFSPPPSSGSSSSLSLPACVRNRSGVTRIAPTSARHVREARVASKEFHFKSTN